MIRPQAYSVAGRLSLWSLQMTDNFWCDRYLQLPWHIIQHLPAGLDYDLGRRHKLMNDWLSYFLVFRPRSSPVMVEYKRFYCIEKHRSPTQALHMELISVVLWTQAVNFRRFRSIRYILSGGTDPICEGQGRCQLLLEWWAGTRMDGAANCRKYIFLTRKILRPFIET